MPRLLTMFVIVVAIVATMIKMLVPVNAISSGVVISQIYGGGGNSGATYKNDFIEIFNRGTSSVSLSGWSVQYASAAGTTWQVTALTNVMLQPGQYYLVQEAAGAGGTTPLPTPDATGSIAMSATAGKVALVNATTPLAGNGCPLRRLSSISWATARPPTVSKVRGRPHRSRIRRRPFGRMAAPPIRTSTAPTSRPARRHLAIA